MTYTLPDSTSPWHSNDEMSAAMTERDHRGLRRYSSDPAFREACEAKTVLGVRVGAAVPTVTQRGAIRVTEGRVEHLGHHQIIAADGEIATRSEIARLEAEVRDLEVRTAEQEQVTAKSIRIRDSIDPSKPVKPFANRAEQIEATRTSEYKNDAIVRAHVEARTRATEFSE